MTLSLKERKILGILLLTETDPQDLWYLTMVIISKYSEVFNRENQVFR